MRRGYIIVIMLLLVGKLYADEQLVLHGRVEHSALFGVNSEELGLKYDFPYLSNTYLDMGLQSKYINAGLRAELMPKPLPGYDDGFAGAGIGNIYVQANYKWLHITVGDVYAQYGSGMVLRLYEDRSLGVDNSLRGGKIVIEPYKGIHLEAIGGKQRVYWNCYESSWGWDYSKGALVGGNVELQIDEWSKSMRERDIRWSIGGSYVSRYEPQDTIYASYSPPMIYNLPRWVGAGEIHTRLNVGDWNVVAEYAYKANDPSLDNNFSYRHGDALFLSAGYSRKGLGVLLQMKRSDNMSFRSGRLLRNTAGRINYMPAFAPTHTYNLAAQYPYATSTSGEWAWQAELTYTWRKKTKMGGKYGTTMSVNLSHIRGTGDKWWSVSKDPYYTDINLSIKKRLSKQWWLNAMYMYQTYNQLQNEEHGSILRSHIFITDLKYQPLADFAFRLEAQYMYTQGIDEHSIFGLLEVSLWHCLMLTASDMYIVGGENYYDVGFTFQRHGHRLQAGFAKQQDGFNCAGGVCRYLPAQNGAVLSYTYSF